MGLDPLAAIRLPCIEQSLEKQRSGGPSTKEDLETIRFCVFAAPGLRRAQASVSISTAEFGFNPSLGRELLGSDPNSVRASIFASPPIRF